MNEKKLTKKEIIWAYKTLLHREPESEDAIDYYLNKVNNIYELCELFLILDEYKHLVNKHPFLKERIYVF